MTNDRAMLRRPGGARALPALPPAHPRHLAAGSGAPHRLGLFLHRDRRQHLSRPDAAEPRRLFARHLPDVEGPRLHDPVRDPRGARRADARADLDALLQAERPARLHPDYGNPGIEASTGSLGHGLSMVVGMALAERGRKTDGTIYTVLSDGEVQEGSTWEAMMMASSLGLTNIVAFVDNNDFQSLGRTSETHPIFYPLVDKFARVRLGDRRGRRPRSAGAIYRRGGEPQRQQAVHGRGRQDHQGQGRQLHGERADLALPLAQPRRNTSRRSRELGGRAMRNTFSEALYEAATQESRHLHRRGRHLAGRQHGEVHAANIPSGSSMSASPSRA